MSGNFLLIYICNFHVLNLFLRIYICKLHWGSYNAFEFLSEAKWTSIEDRKRSGGKREKEQKVKHTFPNGSTIEFVILDDPRSLNSEEDWQRVVAVFASGVDWQFKDWRWSNPVELFQRVLGVHLMLDNDKVTVNVQSWSCKVLKINQFKRHLDAGAANVFWDLVQKYLQLNKPWILTPGGHSSSSSSSSK
jgi:RNA pol II accessory factor, Cdc73 family, C-terminal